MKKIICSLMAVAFMCIMFMSCGNGKTNVDAVDSTQVDTVTVDSLTLQNANQDTLVNDSIVVENECDN